MTTILHLENEDFDDKNMLKSELIFSDGKTYKIEKDDLCMIMIYADWCPYCVHAKPIYNEFVSKYKDKDVKFFKINENQTGLMRRIKKIVGEKITFPSFYFFVDGKKVGKYEGERTIEGLNKSIDKYK
jgi:thiol-disulfide isomerase/thioredoxin